MRASATSVKYRDLAADYELASTSYWDLRELEDEITFPPVITRLVTAVENARGEDPDNLPDQWFVQVGFLLDVMWSMEDSLMPSELVKIASQWASRESLTEPHPWLPQDLNDWRHYNIKVAETAGVSPGILERYRQFMRTNA